MVYDSVARSRQSVADSILGDVCSMVFFRLGVPDAQSLEMLCELFAWKQMSDIPSCLPLSTT